MSVNDASHRIVADLLKARTGQQLTEGRRWRIGTALSGVYRECGISNVDQLVCMLAERGSDELARQVVEALLNNETYFYRDRPMFEQLANTVLPDLAGRRAFAKRLRIWSAGCSTGQEVYTLAMLFAEQPERWGDWDIEIIGTDVSSRVIEAANRSRYTQFEIQRGLGVAQMLKWFHETELGWEPAPELRKMVRFERRNMLDSWEKSTRFDLILCRNVLLYFDCVTRDRAFERLDSQLARDGWLMLGAGETVVGRTGIFEPFGNSQGLCRRGEFDQVETRAAARRAACATR